MLLSSISVLCFLSTTAFTYTVPAGLPDGLYVDSLGSPGGNYLRAFSPQGVNLGAVNVTALAASRKFGSKARLNSRDGAPGEPGLLTREDFEGLPISQYACGTDGKWGEFNFDDYLAARNGYGNYCDSHDIPDHNIVYTIVGSVIVYACSHRGSQPCGRQEYAKFERYVTPQCGGKLTPAWIWMEDWAKVIGRDLSFNAVCTNLI